MHGPYACAMCGMVPVSLHARGICGVQGNGGAIYADDGSQLSVASTSFKDVSAKVPGSGCPT